MMYALIDPNWGEPRVALSTVRETEQEAWRAACFSHEFSLYSGLAAYSREEQRESEYFMLSREKLRSHGFTVKPVRVEIIGE